MALRCLSPVKLGPYTLRNRIVFGAHTNNMAVAGEPSERQIHYLSARNRAGMVVVEPIPVHPTALFAAGNMDRSRLSRHAERLSRLAATVRANGAVGLVQLIHLGQHGEGDVSFMPNWSPSGLPSFIGTSGSHPMSSNEIIELIEGFVETAALVKAAGFDGVELFANYQGLIEQFWSPWFNRRQDEWGGTFAKRMRFAEQILKRIKTRCGSDFICGIAVSYLDLPNVTLSSDDLIESVVWLDRESLVDYVSCGTGGYLDTSKLVPAAHLGTRLGLPLAAKLKATKLKALVQVESGFRSVDDVEATLAAGKADLISMVRAQIADPDLVDKLEAGNADQIRPCLGCNQKCIGRRARDRWISCVVNPNAGREYLVAPAYHRAQDQSRRAVVIGGGPAGLEIATTLGARGATVLLYEREPNLGGVPRLYGVGRFQERWLVYMDWLVEQARHAGVIMETEAPIEHTRLADFHVDAVILAYGANWRQSVLQRACPALAPHPTTKDAFDIVTALRSPNRVGHRVLMLDDHHGWAGLGAAVQIAERGHQVTVMTGAPMLGRDLMPLGVLGPLRRALLAAGGAERVDTGLLTWSNGIAHLQNLVSGVTESVSFDTLVWSGVPMGQLGPDLGTSSNIAPINLIGDALAPRDAAAAVFDAAELGRRLWT